MIILDKMNCLRHMCIYHLKWGMYINFEDSVDKYGNEETIKAAPYLEHYSENEIMSDGEGFLLFDTAGEMQLVYNQTVGDNSPALRNDYMGPAKVYLCCCNPLGEIFNENT